MAGSLNLTSKFKIPGHTPKPQTFSDWLHALPADTVKALRDFRTAARQAYPDSKNPTADAVGTAQVEAFIRSLPPPVGPSAAIGHELLKTMPPAFVRRIDH